MMKKYNILEFHTRASAKGGALHQNEDMLSLESQLLGLIII